MALSPEPAALRFRPEAPRPELPPPSAPASSGASLCLVLRSITVLCGRFFSCDQKQNPLTWGPLSVLFLWICCCRQKGKRRNLFAPDASPALFTSSCRTLRRRAHISPGFLLRRTPHQRALSGQMRKCRQRDGQGLKFGLLVIFTSFSVALRRTAKPNTGQFFPFPQFLQAGSPGKGACFSCQENETLTKDALQA